MHHLSDSSISPAEKDDQQVERLINKEPAPSRKNRPKRGPKHSNRRRRMLDSQDSDAKAVKRDRQSSLVDIALRIAFGGPIGATSYETVLTEDMPSKIAAYHGLVKQGHPSGPTNTEYKSYDSRYFGKEHFDSIVAQAKELLKSDWIKYGWDAGSEDAPIRAALDLAIQLTDNNLYQSKIDVNNYNMLLAKLSGSDVDLFSETLVAGGKTKKGSVAMNKNIQNMIRIANELRHSDPRAAFEIIKNIQAIRTGGDSDGQEQYSPDTVKDPPTERHPGPGGGGGDQTSQQQQQSGKTKGVNVKDVKHQLDMFSKARTPEDLMEVLEKIKETAHISSHHLARISSDLAEELAPIADMSDEEIQKLVSTGKRDVTKLEAVLKDFDEMKPLSPEGVEALVKGIDDFLNAIVLETEKVSTASVSVSISTLLRVASISPEARLIVKPILVAAKKKMDAAKKKKKKEETTSAKKAPAKKAPAKKAPAKKGPKGPPFGGKKAPPFGKGKGKSKKASVSIGSDDSSW